MDFRAFRSFSESCHRSWLSILLNLDTSDRRDGIDLTGENIAIEIKCRYRGSPATTFTIHADQIAAYRKQHKGKALFWAFVDYDLGIPPRRIRRTSQIPGQVTERQVYLVPWEFVDGLEVHETKTGRYVYVPKKKLRSGKYADFAAEGGNLHVPKGSVLEKMLAA